MSPPEDTMPLNRKDILQMAAQDAGNYIADQFGRKRDIRKKGELDLVTEADETAERIVVDTILASFPDDGILAEEGGGREGANAFQWIVDPLDGTTNFAHGFPQFSVSIALANAGEVISGVVFDPFKDEWFEAHKGSGATLNGKPVMVGERSELSQSLGVTGFSYDRRERMDALLQRVRLILEHCQGLRRLGSAALDLAYIACGRFDVFLEDGLNAWDMAAGQLLVTEAGGAVSLLDGAPYDVHRGEIMAANQTLLPQALEKLVQPNLSPAS
jgi:myo-inositol-1(or 4)-monophosphatase